jgi:hypothetical protein
VYSAGQLPTTLSAPLYLLALPYFYEWSRFSSWRALLKGLVLGLAAASAHHVTLLFGSVLFAVPVLWLACSDARAEERSTAPVLSRALAFVLLTIVGVGIVLLPYWIAIIRHPIEQIPIPHGSRLNYLVNWTQGLNYFVVPYGAMILALPFVVVRGATVPRLRILLVAFWITFLLGLGGTSRFRPRVRDSHLRTLHSLGNAAGAPHSGFTGRERARSFPRPRRILRGYCRRSDPFARSWLAYVEPVSHHQQP